VVWQGGLSVVLPAYNEVGNIRFSVIIAHAILSELVREFEIIVVSDGSTDGTDREVDELVGRYANLKLIRKPENEGYGFALRDGFAAATLPHVFFTDADRQFDLVSLQDLLPHVGQNDIVIGYRQRRQDTLVRRLVSQAYNVVVRMMFGLDVRDVDCAFKVFRRSIFERIHIDSPRFFVNTEILAKARRLDLRIHQVGVRHLPRLQDLSKVGWWAIPETVRDLLQIRRSLARTLGPKSDAALASRSPSTLAVPRDPAA